MRADGAVGRVPLVDDVALVRETVVRLCDDRSVKNTVLVCAALLLALTGCAASEPEQKPVETSQKPAIDPGPIQLTEAEAGERYLGIVCQGNFASDALWAAFLADEDEFLNGGAPAPDAVKAAAAEKARLTRQEIELIDDPYYTWPVSVQALLPLIRDDDAGYLPYLEAVAGAATFESAYDEQEPELPAEQAAAPLEIRRLLGLDADTTASCVGFETKNDALFNEMVERNALLAKADA